MITAELIRRYTTGTEPRGMFVATPSEPSTTTSGSTWKKRIISRCFCQARRAVATSQPGQRRTAG